MIEIEKKYKLSKEVFDVLQIFLKADFFKKVKEENTLYKGNALTNKEVLRLRAVIGAFGAQGYVLTYKGEAVMSEDGIKSREELEFETRANPDKFIKALGFSPILIYEKKRIDFRAIGAVISLDELPFGYYMEIEGNDNSIQNIERKLKNRVGMELDVETNSYPDLTQIYGKSINGIVEARFA